WKINLQVCYDLRFPVWARQQTTEKPEYDLLIYVANWPARRSYAWKQLLVARAIENQCYVIGVNRIGEDGNGIEHSG
ncbi:nitrilase-related carbon-nitrogen hydrolase, partial [Acinetobacter baumannii]